MIKKREVDTNFRGGVDLKQTFMSEVSLNFAVKTRLLHEILMKMYTAKAWDMPGSHFGKLIVCSSRLLFCLNSLCHNDTHYLCY